CATAECHAGYLFSEHVHGPVSEGACGVCHAPDSGGHVYPVSDRPQRDCAACHDIGARHEFRHMAMTEDGCLACHDPHVSSLPGLLTEDSVGATCAACHPTTAGHVGHEPYVEGECTSCHDPHAEDNRLLLHGGEGGDHCGLCHGVTVETMRNAQHNFDGDCMRCHSGHASDWPGLLGEDSALQCLRCHEGVREMIETSVVTHRGAMTDRRCVTCHLPHASREDSMLRENQIGVCISCHDTPVEAIDGRTIPDMTPAVQSAEHRHGPVDHGRCNLCHSVHGSSYARLLRGSNPELVIGEFDVRNYALCFSCHAEALVTEAESTAVTAFHDGTRNLHHLHVASGGRARSCSTCHVVHGGSRPRLMADFAVYEGSARKMPLGFTMTERGGSCAPGCHEPLAYDRETGGPG
ncbi:MAG: cytochrome c3 family protein, partial [Phycisphaerales bacterium]|nr:cytochrome c3 family protein [Phycisphaerales bacterium]